MHDAISVQQGGELAYLIRHDPEFRGVRREHLIEAGLVLEIFQPSQLRHFHARVLLLIGRLGNLVLATGLGDFRAGFDLFKDPDDLFLYGRLPFAK